MEDDDKPDKPGYMGDTRRAMGGKLHRASAVGIPREVNDGHTTDRVHMEPAPPINSTPAELGRYYHDAFTMFMRHAEERMDRRMKSFDNIIAELATYKERTDESKSVLAATRTQLDEMLEDIRRIGSNHEWVKTSQKTHGEQLDGIAQKLTVILERINAHETGTKTEFVAVGTARSVITTEIAAIRGEVASIRKDVDEVKEGQGEHTQLVQTAATGYKVARYVIGCVIAIAALAYPYISLAIK